MKAPAVKSPHAKSLLVAPRARSSGNSKFKPVVAPLHKFGKPLGVHAGPMPFAGWQTAFDPLLAPGARNYWKSHDFKAVAPALEGILLDAVAGLPGDECEIFVGHLGGAVNRVAADATAYPHRDVNYIVNVHTRWREPGDDARCIAWARSTFDAMTPHATGGVYVNFMPEDEAGRVAVGAYGANFARLAPLKAKYDPTNLFRRNQNIKPGG